MIEKNKRTSVAQEFEDVDLRNRWSPPCCYKEYKEFAVTENSNGLALVCTSLAEELRAASARVNAEFIRRVDVNMEAAAAAAAAAAECRPGRKKAMKANNYKAQAYPFNVEPQV